jgi:hypothetical protein
MNFFSLLMILAAAAVLISLVLGLIVMVKGGEVNKKYGNRLMRARVTLQGLALLFFVLAMMGSDK